jgi:aryl-alcohol dehydrogenase-like predicted oxidoreductase
VPLMPTPWLAVLCLFLRATMSQMDVPSRKSYSMAVVDPDEQTVTAGITNTTRTIASAFSPVLSGFAFGAAALGVPFCIAGEIKLVYDGPIYALSVGRRTTRRYSGCRRGYMHMLRRSIGRTGMQTSEIGFGCGPTAGLMVYGTAHEQRAAVQRAYEVGITYFDTAPIYGDYVSEENLGRALRAAGIRPQIATKVALETPDLDDIRGAVRKSVEDSLRRLRVESVTSVQVHNRVASTRADRADLGVGAQVTPEDVLGPMLETLQALREEGKTQVIGCCAWGGEYASICRVLESGAFDTVLVGYSVLNPTSGRAAPAGFVGRDFGNVMQTAADHGTSAVVLRVLESGALTGATAPHPTSSLARRPNVEFTRNAARARSLQFLARADQTLTQAAIRFALGDARVSTVLVGFSALDQIDKAAASSGIGLSETELASIEHLYRSDFALRQSV